MSSGEDGTFGSEGGFWGMENFGSGGGGNFFTNMLNTYTQMMTAGVVQVNDNGLKVDAKDDVGLNIYKEMSGAKAAEQATKQAAEQFEEQKKNSEKTRQESIYKNQVDQVTQSNMAAGVRANGTTRSTQGNLTLGQDEKDFLGL